MHCVSKAASERIQHGAVQNGKHKARQTEPDMRRVIGPSCHAMRCELLLSLMTMIVTSWLMAREMGVRGAAAAIQMASGEEGKVETTPVHHGDEVSKREGESV